jgi:hypothetical protein
LSLSILVGLSCSPPTPFAVIACYPFTSPSFLFYLIIHPYSSDGKGWNLQCQQPWQQQRHESTTSQLVVGHAELAFRDHGAKATCPQQDSTHRRKTPVKKDEE